MQKISKLLLVMFISSASFSLFSGQAYAASTCSSQQPINTQFRLSSQGDTPWLSGDELSRQGVQTGQRIDVNCFAKNGTALLEGGTIEVNNSSGRPIPVSTTAELRSFTVNEARSYTFVCSSNTIASCSDSDTVTVRQIPMQIPFFPPMTVDTPPPLQPSPSPTPRSSCDSLQVVGGNDSLVPAHVTLRTRGSDNLGNIQKYRFYFGDGQWVETDSTEVTHDYNSSGTFIARADIKDSRGNYQTSSACEASVYVKPSRVESFKSKCSNVFVTADNNGKAPSTVKFEVTGYDNKGDIQGYKLDFGNGVMKESQGRTFEQRYDQVGSYDIKAYIKNSHGEYVGGDNSCQRTLTIGSNTPLTHQPATGMPTVVPVLGMISGGVGIGLRYLKSRLRA